MTTCYWEETDSLGLYITTDTREVRATLKQGVKIGEQWVWEWVERKRSFLGRQHAIRAVERAV